MAADDFILINAETVPGGKKVATILANDGYEHEKTITEFVDAANNPVKVSETDPLPVTDEVAENALTTLVLNQQSDALTNTQLRAVPVPVTISGGGGGAVTIADGADVTEGAIADAIVAAGAAGTVSAKLRRTTQGLEDLKTSISLAVSSNVIGHVINDAGAAIIGKVGIDQTTPGTTNGVQIAAALPAGTNLIGIVQSKDLPDASVTYALSNATSTAYEASHVIKASAGYLYMVTGYNSKASSQFIMISNTTSVPADGQTPVLLFTIPASSNFSLDLGKYGRYFSTGICIFNSSTAPTKLVGSADCFFDCQYI